MARAKSPVAPPSDSTTEPPLTGGLDHFTPIGPGFFELRLSLDAPSILRLNTAISEARNAPGDQLARFAQGLRNNAASTAFVAVADRLGAAREAVQAAEEKIASCSLRLTSTLVSGQDTADLEDERRKARQDYADAVERVELLTEVRDDREGQLLAERKDLAMTFTSDLVQRAEVEARESEKRLVEVLAAAVAELETCRERARAAGLTADRVRLGHLPWLDCATPLPTDPALESEPVGRL